MIMYGMVNGLPWIIARPPNLMIDPTAAEEDAGKRDKASVNYRRSQSEDERCGTCRYAYGAIGERRCRIVKGFINPYDTCDEWEKKR